jgi:hypothetical protein
LGNKCRFPHNCCPAATPSKWSCVVTYRTSVLTSVNISWHLCSQLFISGTWRWSPKPKHLLLSSSYVFAPMKEGEKGHKSSHKHSSLGGG